MIGVVPRSIPQPCPAPCRIAPSRSQASCEGQVQQIGHGKRAPLNSGQEQSLCSIGIRPSLRPDLPSGRAPRAAAVKDAAATAAAPAEPARSVLDRASTVLG